MGAIKKSRLRRGWREVALASPAVVLGFTQILTTFMAGDAVADHATGTGGALHVRVFDDFGGFDHVLAPHAGLSRLQVLFAVHDRLFEISTKSGKPVPRLAVRAAPRGDFRIWRVTLRPGVKFSNGEPVDANAYVQHFKRLLNSEYARRFHAVMGAPLKNVTASGKLIIEFQFSRSNPGFRALLSYGGTYVWSINAPGFMARNRMHPGLTGKSAGAGPYRIALWEQGRRVVLKRNPDYWDPDIQHLDEITYHVVDESGTEGVLRRLQSGRLDAAMITSDAAIQAALKPRRFSVYRRTLDQFGTMIGFNRALAPLGDPVVRLALAQAIDRSRIARALGGSNADVADQLFHGERWRCRDVGYPAFDPECARNILQALDVDFSTVSLWTEDEPPLRMAASLIQKMWASAGISIGVHVIAPQDHGLTYQVVAGRAAIWLQPLGPFVHPSLSDLSLHSASQQNISRLNSPKIDKAIARLGEARKDKDILDAHCGFERLKTEVLPYLPVKRGVIGLITRNDIGGVALTGDPVIGYHRMFRK